MTDPILPPEIERDLTLVHSETCDCGAREGGDSCLEVRSILRRSIAAGLIEHQATRFDWSLWEMLKQEEYLAALRARAKAIREGRDA